MVNRQLEIIYILMKKGTVTAEELAAHFEVSTRTVYRDVESLSMAGIPVYASRGKGGGIRLMERFVLDRRLLSREEQGRILAAMASLRETGAAQDERILRKLETFFQAESMDWVAIDFSDWSGRRGELFGQMKEAVLGRHVMVFDYYGQYGDMARREVEPIQLLFKDYTWYLRAFCRVRGAMRLFKVLRMKRVEVLEEVFEPGQRHQPELSLSGAGSGSEPPLPGAGSGSEPGSLPGEGSGSEPSLPQEGMVLQREVEEGRTGEREWDAESGKPGESENAVESGKSREPESEEIIFRIDRKEAYRVYDRFEEDEITVLPQGDFRIRMCCPLDDWVYGLILSFGPSARVLEPDRVREELKRKIRQMAALYDA